MTTAQDLSRLTGAEWARADVTVALATGPRVVRGFVSATAPGLAVTPVQSQAPGMVGRWVITHMTSGLCFNAYGHGETFSCAEVACRVAVRLAELGDWNVPAEHLTIDRLVARQIMHGAGVR